MSFKVTFLPDNKAVEANEGDNLLELALENGIELEHNCGGNCSCTTCHVITQTGVENLSEMEEEEEDRLEECDEQTSQSRLGCQVIVNGPCTVEIPDRDPFKLDGLAELEDFGEDLLDSK